MTKKRDQKKSSVEAINRIGYSPKQFADASSISVGLLYKLWREGRGPPYVMLNSRRIVPRKSGEDWLQGQVVTEA